VAGWIDSDFSSSQPAGSDGWCLLPAAYQVAALHSAGRQGVVEKAHGIYDDPSNWRWGWDACIIRCAHGGPHTSGMVECFL